MITPDEIKKFKVQDLRDELQLRGLDTTGLKATLAERLEGALIASDAPAANGNAPAGPAGEENGTEPAAAQHATPESHPTAKNPSPVNKQVPEPKEVLADKPVVAQPPISAEDINTVHLSEEERRKMRAQRFNSGTEKGNNAEIIGKLKDRAKRFGLPQPVFAAEEAAKKKARAERFNLPKSKEEIAAEERAKASAEAVEQLEKKRQRAERFGIVSDADKAAARAKRFATNATPSSSSAQPETDKLKARAQRFAAS